MSSFPFFFVEVVRRTFLLPPLLRAYEQGHGHTTFFSSTLNSLFFSRPLLCVSEQGHGQSYSWARHATVRVSYCSYGDST